MRRIICFISLLLILSNTAYAYSSNPKDFINEMLGETINTLSNKNLTKEEKAKFVEKVAVENVDIEALGLYTLGELRKSAAKQALEKYQESFKKYFLKA